MPATQRTQAPSQTGSYAGHDDYYAQPYRRAPTFDSVRETTEPEGRPTKADKYMPLASEQTPKKQASFVVPAGGGYGGGGGNEGTPSKRPRGPRRRGTSVYFVREGDDDGSGTPPPASVLELPFMGWLKGPLRNSKCARTPVYDIADRNSVRCLAWRVRWHYSVSLVRFRRHDSSQHRRAASYIRVDRASHSWLLAHRHYLRLHCIRLQPDG